MVFILGASLSPEDELNPITGRPTLSLSFEGLYPAEGPVGAPPPISSQLCAPHPISPRRILFYPAEGSEDNPSVPLAQRPAPCPAQGRLHPAGERVACVWPGEEEQLQFQPSRQHPKLYMYILN